LVAAILREPMTELVDAAFSEPEVAILAGNPGILLNVRYETVGSTPQSVLEPLGSTQTDRGR
jgi:hypothetical protein